MADHSPMKRSNGTVRAKDTTENNWMQSQLFGCVGAPSVPSSMQRKVCWKSRTGTVGTLLNENDGPKGMLLFDSLNGRRSFLLSTPTSLLVRPPLQFLTTPTYRCVYLVDRAMHLNSRTWREDRNLASEATQVVSCGLGVSRKILSERHVGFFSHSPIGFIS
jgi:hypothetical protein